MTTDDNNPTNEFSDRQMMALLERTTSVIPPESPNKKQIFDSVLREFDQRSNHPTDSDRTGGSDDLLEVIRLGEPIGGHQPRRLRAVWLGGIAASIAIVAMILSTQVSISDQNSVSTAEDGGERSTTTTEPVSATSEVLSGGIELDLPEGIELLTEEPGRIVLGRPDTGDGASALVTIIDIGDMDFQQRLNELDRRGDVFSAQFPVKVGDETLRRWEVSVTQAAVQANGCAGLDPCLRLTSEGDDGEGSPQVRIPPGRTFVIQIPQDSGETVLWIEPDGGSGPQAVDFSSVLERLVPG